MLLLYFLLIVSYSLNYNHVYSKMHTVILPDYFKQGNKRFVIIIQFSSLIIIIISIIIQFFTFVCCINRQMTDFR
jgi:hypothetical protein